MKHHAEPAPEEGPREIKIISHANKRLQLYQYERFERFKTF